MTPRHIPKASRPNFSVSSGPLFGLLRWLIPAASVTAVNAPATTPALPKHLETELTIFLRQARTDRDRDELRAEFKVAVSITGLLVIYTAWTIWGDQLVRTSASSLWTDASNYAVPIATLAGLVLALIGQSLAFRQLAGYVLPTLHITALAIAALNLPNHVDRASLIVLLVLIAAAMYSYPFILAAHHYLDAREAFIDPPGEDRISRIQARRGWLWLDTLVIPLASCGYAVWIASLYVSFAQRPAVASLLGGRHIGWFVGLVVMWLAAVALPTFLAMRALDLKHDRVVRKRAHTVLAKSGSATKP